MISTTAAGVTAPTTSFGMRGFSGTPNAASPRPIGWAPCGRITRPAGTHSATAPCATTGLCGSSYSHDGMGNRELITTAPLQPGPKRRQPVPPAARFTYSPMPRPAVSGPSGAKTSRPQSSATPLSHGPQVPCAWPRSDTPIHAPSSVAPSADEHSVVSRSLIASNNAGWRWAPDDARKSTLPGTAGMVESTAVSRGVSSRRRSSTCGPHCSASSTPPAADGDCADLALVAGADTMRPPVRTSPIRQIDITGTHRRGTAPAAPGSTAGDIPHSAANPGESRTPAVRESMSGRRAFRGGRRGPPGIGEW